MLIVAGHVVVDAAQRAEYLQGCEGVVTAARSAPGCMDFAISADLVEAGRINIYERWDSDEHLQAFRGSGPDPGQQAQILDMRVDEYAVG